MSDLANFKQFYASFIAAVKKGDEGALRAILPPGIPEDHFGFLWQLNQTLASESTEPTYTCTGDFATITYELVDENGTETMTREFWWHDGKWLSYNPAEPF